MYVVSRRWANYVDRAASDIPANFCRRAKSMPSQLPIVSKDLYYGEALPFPRSCILDDLHQAGATECQLPYIKQRTTTRGRNQGIARAGMK
jgi:hypothetical protein